MVSAAGIYARISSDRDGDRLGVGRQLDDCRALAARRSWRVAEEYVDDDCSAYSGRQRPAYRRMLADLHDGLIDAVVVYDQDRLTRQPVELEEFFVVCDSAGVSDLASVTGALDLSTHSGQFTARILGAVARKESDDKSRRIRRKHQELAAAGKVSGGGARPFGFEPDRRTVVPAEAEVIVEVAGRVLAGDSVRSICADLDARNIPTVSGGTWNTSVLSKMLVSARISGQREHHGEIVGPAEWPAIISPDQTAALRTLLASRRRDTARQPRRYLLAGLLRCDLCGATLISRPRAGGVRQYVCGKGPGLAGCGKITVLAEQVEQLVTVAVLARIDTPAFARTIERGVTKDSTTNQLRADLADDQALLDDLAGMFGNRDISRDEWLAARKPVDARIATTRKKLSRVTTTTTLDGYVGNGETLRSEWGHLDLTKQHAIVAAVLDHAVIASAVRGRNTFDENRVTPVWKK